jgi:hypothetical protein
VRNFVKVVTVVKRFSLAFWLVFICLCIPLQAGTKKIHSDHPIYKRSLESLQKQAIVDVAACREGLLKWSKKIRPADGTKGRFNWAVKFDSDKPANIISTKYAVGTFGNAGILDEVIDEEDKKAGIAWVKSMEQEAGGYFDPVYSCGSGKVDSSVCKGGCRGTVNLYAEDLLQFYGVDAEDVALSPPPEGWPQIETAQWADDWIRMRTWEYDTWAAGANSGRAVYYLYQWYLADKIGIEPLVDAIKEVYSLQDPKTGLWSNRSKSNCTLQNRINGTFKVLGTISKQLDLPLFHCEKMVDTVIDLMTSDDYAGSRSGCDELDNIFVLAIASDHSDNYRREEVQKLAAYSISLIKEQYLREDGGLSFYPDYCQHNWLGHQVSPIVLQGDVMGSSVHTYGLTIAVDIAGLNGKVEWSKGDWRENWKARIPDAERKLKALRGNLSDVLQTGVLMK